MVHIYHLNKKKNHIRKDAIIVFRKVKRFSRAGNYHNMRALFWRYLKILADPIVIRNILQPFATTGIQHSHSSYPSQLSFTLANEFSPILTIDSY